MLFAPSYSANKWRLQVKINGAKTTRQHTHSFSTFCNAICTFIEKCCSPCLKCWCWPIALAHVVQASCSPSHLLAPEMPTLAWSVALSLPQCVCSQAVPASRSGTLWSFCCRLLRSPCHTLCKWEASHQVLAPFSAPFSACTRLLHKAFRPALLHSCQERAVVLAVFKLCIFCAICISFVSHSFVFHACRTIKAHSRTKKSKPLS